jgi:acetoin utilization deacetylase AcuC-like enzyme
MLKVFFSENQSVASNNSFSPSAGKPELFVEYLKKSYADLNLCDFDPVTRDDLKLVHSKRFVDGILDLKIPNGFWNKSPDVAEALQWVAGSMVAASLDALKNNTITISPTSGAHHAHYDSAGGYCTFNFLALAALKAHHAGARKVGIIDLDCHYGDGTQNIIECLNLDFIKQYSFGADQLPKKSAQAWIEKLPEIVLSFNDCDLILYNAGVDSHINDPLGGYLTTEQIKKRDEIVLGISRQLKIPVAVSLAGGYQKDKNGGISAVLNLHGMMFEIARVLMLKEATPR